MRRILVPTVALLLLPSVTLAATVVWSSRQVKRATPTPAPVAVVAASDSAETARRIAAREAAQRDSIAKVEAARIVATREAAHRDSVAKVEAARIVATREAARRDSLARVEAARLVASREAAHRDSLAKAEAARLVATREASHRDSVNRANAKTPLAPASIAKNVAATASIVPTPAWSPGAETRTSRINYLAGRSAYLEAGEAQGLRVGDSIGVTRQGATIALLRVAFVSTRRASCDTLWTTAPIAVGDAVVWRHDAARVQSRADAERRLALEADSVRTVAVLTPPRDRAAQRSARTHGRLGARWLSVATDASGSYRQPGLELRLDSHDAFGGHVDASLDVRGRRTMRTSAYGNSTEQLSRVYRASTTLRDERDRRRLTLGRQTSPTLASVSLFDGALLEWVSPTRTMGAFTGTQPDPTRFTWSRELVEGGGFVEWHQRPLSTTRWSVATGAITSRTGRVSNRDFGFVQGSWSSHGMSATAAQEIDLNTGWKRTLGEPLVSWTSTFATLRVPVGSVASFNTGYDNRRNVRLWRDRETPETDFDDRYRQGAWLGGDGQWGSHLRGGAEWRVGSGGDHSDTRSVHLEVHRWTRLQATLRGRLSSFTSPATNSGLWSFAAGFDPGSRSHLEFTAGTRRTTDRLTTITDREHWQGMDLDLSLGGRWYLNGGYEQQQGLAGTTRQVQAGASVRL